MSLAGLLGVAYPPTPVSAQVLLDEQFNGDAVNTSLFTFSGAGDESFFGRTQLNSPGLPAPFEAPPVADGVLQLRLNTFNPFSPGDFFLGEEVRTQQVFTPVPDAVLSFETRARFVDDAVNPLAPGLVGGAFLFGVDANFPNPAERDEVDFELLSNFPNGFITTNIFNDEGFDTGGAFVGSPVTGLDLTVFNDYRIELSLDAIRFFVNDVLIREATEDLADEAQDFRLNINAPDQFFGAAFNDALQPTADQSQNQTFIFEVDSLVITQAPVPEPTTLALFAAASLLTTRRGRVRR